jgi:outer membrane beta-barrel protein
VDNSDAFNAERVNTETIKQKYWARGDETEMGVVQNRLYSKARKFELQILGGILPNDPFVTTYGVGGRFGFHFSEYFSAHFLGWKAYASNSSIVDTLHEAGKTDQQIGTALNTDFTKYYLGGELQASLLYGKLSVIGKAIIYYDLHLLGGFGTTQTESGSNFTQHIGIGQQFYVNKSMSINIDYRAMHYRDELLNKIEPTKAGQTVGSRSSWTNAITVGVGFLFGGPKK